ncbi:hypothetical protein JW960_06190 [candidate division KSB1 bacterium]|nr:hypothetical protein [candidate division KSB1 bacterium]
MEKHITLVAALNIGLGALGLLIALVVFLAVVGGGILSGDEDAMMITSIVGTTVGGFIALVSIPGIIAGIGLLKRQSWARILALIVAVLDLLNIPIGTALGVYTIWVLIQEETIQLLSGATPSA